MRAAPYAGTFSELARRLGRLFPLSRLLRSPARHRILERLDRVRAARLADVHGPHFECTPFPATTAPESVARAAVSLSAWLSP
jgi:hypothetical protein